MTVSSSKPKVEVHEHTGETVYFQCFTLLNIAYSICLKNDCNLKKPKCLISFGILEYVSSVSYGFTLIKYMFQLILLSNSKWINYCSNIRWHSFIYIYLYIYKSLNSITVVHTKVDAWRGVLDLISALCVCHSKTNHPNQKTKQCKTDLCRFLIDTLTRWQHKFQ